VLAGGDGLVRMELVIGAEPAPAEDAARMPTDLVVILDRSGSMAGEKLAQARAAVRELVARLGTQDRFALVTYSDGATLTLPLAPAEDGIRDGWLQAVDAITAEGSTNMSSGLDLGLDVIERARAAGRVPRAILISDGLANQGDPTPEGLTRRAARAARGEYMLTTVGVGDDFNEYLMTALADAGTGNYYYLHGAEDLATVFAREFTAARHTVATGLAVRIEPAAGVRVVDAAGYPLEQTGDAVVFRPGSLFAGQRRSIWVTLAVPHDAPGEHPLGRIALAYTDCGEPVTLALAETPHVSCVGREDDFYAHVDVPAWTRSVVQEGYNEMQDAVARELKAGRRDGALERIRRYRADVAEKNARLKSAPVGAQLKSLEKLEADVKGAFVGPHALERQNVLSKTMSADALDQRRAGSKQ